MCWRMAKGGSMTQETRREYYAYTACWGLALFAAGIALGWAWW